MTVAYDLLILFVVVWSIGHIVAAGLLYQRRPREQYQRYPYWVSRQFTLPFMKAWRDNIDPIDLPVIDTWRYRLLSFLSILWAQLAVFYFIALACAR